MSSEAKPKLVVDWCSHEAAKYAVMKWHYSKKMPIGKLVKIGVWESGKFCGAVIFSTGASAQLHKAFKLEREQVCELVRVALDAHAWETSKIVSIAIKMLKRSNQGTLLIVSFADPEQEHIGTLYQAGNWVYIGRSSRGLYYRLPDGTLTHNRNMHGPVGSGGKRQTWDRGRHAAILKDGLKSGQIQKVETEPKYKYVYPLNTEIRDRVELMRKPYPKREDIEASQA